MKFLILNTKVAIVAADYSITTTTANLVPGTTTTMSFRTNNARWTTTNSADAYDANDYTTVSKVGAHYTAGCLGSTDIYASSTGYTNS